MSIFVETNIERARTHPSSLPPSPEEYFQLLERVHREAQRQQAHARAWELARQQGVKPIQNMDDLKGDFWPEDESVDDFLEWVRELRQSDKPRSIPE